MNDRRRSQTGNDHPPTGSPQPGEPLYLVIGRFHKPHGLKGEIFLELLTDFPERVRRGKKIYVGEERQPEIIAFTRPHQSGLLVQLAAKETVESVEGYKNAWVYVRTDELPELPKGEYYFHQLVGMKVYNEEGVYLGEVRQILETGANDVYLIHTPEGAELLLPAIEDVIKEISIAEGRMIVSPPEWY